MDAYCPHMGAHLAEGGVVKDSCIECPFHQWQIRGCDGEVTKIPYTDKIPSNAKGKSWHTFELAGMVLLWNDAEG